MIYTLHLKIITENSNKNYKEELQTPIYKYSLFSLSGGAKSKVIKKPSPTTKKVIKKPSPTTKKVIKKSSPTKK